MFGGGFVSNANQSSPTKMVRGSLNMKTKKVYECQHCGKSSDRWGSFMRGIVCIYCNTINSYWSTNLKEVEVVDVSLLLCMDGGSI